MNAMNKDLAVGVNEALGRLDADQSINVVVIAGAGRAFCAGGDLSVIGKGRQNNDLTELEPILRAGMQAVIKIRTMRQPVIPAVHGAPPAPAVTLPPPAPIR